MHGTMHRLSVERFLGGGPQDDTLSTPEKLAVLQDDPNAGFFPVTHMEKNQALATLDYLDKPEFPLGLHHAMSEIYDHHKLNFRFPKQIDGTRVTRPVMSSHAAAIKSQITIASVLYTFGDHMVDAARSHHRLAKFGAVILDTDRPSLTVAQAMADHKVEDPQLLFAPFLRYLDLRKLMLGERNSGFDPLQTVEVRLAKSGSANHSMTRAADEKFDVRNVQPNKHVAGPYVHVPIQKNRRAKIAAYLPFEMERMLVGDVRQDVRPALNDTVLRGGFWGRVLDNLGYTYGDLAKDIAKRARTGRL